MISASADITRLVRKMDDLSRSQVPYSIRDALNSVADMAKANAVAKMREVFDRPTPFTLQGLVVKRANAKTLTAELRAKDIQNKYLSFEVFGGQRRDKRFEMALQAKGAMPSGYYAVPARGVPLDGFGNVSRGLIAQIISQLGTELRSGYQSTAKSGAALKRARSRNGVFFAMMPGNQQRLPPGIYQRTKSGFGWQTRMIFLFVRQAQYKTLLDLQAITQDVFNAHYADEFRKALVANVAAKRARGA